MQAKEEWAGDGAWPGSGAPFPAPWVQGGGSPGLLVAGLPSLAAQNDAAAPATATGARGGCGGLRRGGCTEGNKRRGLGGLQGVGGSGECATGVDVPSRGAGPVAGRAGRQQVSFPLCQPPPSRLRRLSPP